MRVERIVEATNWEPLRLELSWNTIEDEFVTPLPEDYKRFAETFSKGEFSQFMHVLCVDATRQSDLTQVWHRYIEDIVHRMLTDPGFEPFSVARFFPRPTFRPMGQVA